MPYGMDDEWGNRTGSGNAGGLRNFIKSLWVPPGGFVTLRFLSEHDQIYKNWTHHNLKITSNGKEYWGDRVCVGTDKCEYCIGGHKATKMFFAWVYLLNKYWPVSTPEEKRKNAIVERGKANGREWLIETVNAPYLWKRTFGMDNTYWLDLKQFKERFNDTLRDRVYEIHRLGEETKPTYNMIHTDPSPMGDELLQLAVKMPELEKVALLEITTLDLTDSQNNPSSEFVTVKKTVDDDDDNEDPDDIEDLLPSLPF